MTFTWPPSFPRIPSEPWVAEPLHPRGVGYDALKTQRWYRNLDRTVASALEVVRPGALYVDYSCGTGIFAERLFKASPVPFGLVNVDVLPAFLRVALEKLRGDARAAFRVVPTLERGGLMPLDALLGDALVARGIDGLFCTNAIHLYDDLEGAVRGFARALAPGAKLFVQSAEMRNPSARAGELLITDFVRTLREHAVAIVRRDARYAHYRSVLDDAARMAAYDAVYAAIFQPVKPVSVYVDALDRAGFDVEQSRETVVVGVDEWYAAAVVYSDIVAWIGGTKAVDGGETSAEALQDRREILLRAKEEAFGKADTFDACWTHLRGRRRG